MLDIQAVIRQYHNEPLNLLRDLGGYYLRPPGGPLVGYAGTYVDNAGMPRNFVGEEYANFATAESWPTVIDMWARRISFIYSSSLKDVNVFLGAPEGGKPLAYSLAMCNSLQYVYPGVKETPRISGGKPHKEFIWGRLHLQQDMDVAIVEDVANNFSTTEKLIELVLRAGSRPRAIVCLLNRSMTVEETYESESIGPLPVLALVRKPIPEYRQDDPRVALDIAAGNIVWEPKKTPDNWKRLEDAMAAQSRSAFQKA